jgi:hypothetical protein
VNALIPLLHYTENNVRCTFNLVDKLCLNQGQLVVNYMLKRDHGMETVA